jgi:hypothetical protein
MDTSNSLYEKVHETQMKLTELRIDHWMDYNLFTWQWWTLVLLSVIPWIIWWHLVDRKRIKEIMIFGLNVLILATILDAFGYELGLWGYPYKLIPLFSRQIPFDFSVIPVAYMLIYQYFLRWKTFFVAIVILSVIFSFIGEPFLIWIGIYQPISWKHIYSFPIYIVMALFLRGVTEIIVQQKRES